GHRAVGRPRYQHYLLHRAVVRLELLVGHGPVHAHSIAGGELEIAGHHARGATHPALGIAAESGARVPLLARIVVLEGIVRVDAVGWWTMVALQTTVPQANAPQGGRDEPHGQSTHTHGTVGHSRWNRSLACTCGFLM